MYTKLVIEIKESGFINNVCTIFSSIAFCVTYTVCQEKTVKELFSDYNRSYKCFNTKYLVALR
jgi:hypothetical protein